MSTWPSEAMCLRTDRVPGVLLRRLNVTLAMPWALAGLLSHTVIGMAGVPTATATTGA